MKALHPSSFILHPSSFSWLITAVSLAIVLVVALLLLAPRGPASSLDRAAVAWLPRFNASLNIASVILLSAAYGFIRRRQVEPHRFCMLGAFGLSSLFLVSYVVYHAVAGSTRFTGPDWLRPIYLAILISHITLAALVPPLALTTLYHAWRGAFVRHRPLARWTFPIWLYTSASGVVIYLLLYYGN